MRVEADSVQRRTRTIGGVRSGCMWCAMSLRSFGGYFGGSFGLLTCDQPSR